MKQVRTFEELNGQVITWGDNRGLTKFENRFVQLAKVTEELGELSRAMLKGKSHHFDQADAVGDLIVTIILLARQLDLNVVDCLEDVYGVIENRKGETVDGTFRKFS